MRVFDEPNMVNFRCPVCGTSDKKPVVLVGIAGTEEGGNIEAEQFHVDCINLTMFPMGDGYALVQTFEEQGKSETTADELETFSPEERKSVTTGLKQTETHSLGSFAQHEQEQENDG